MALITGAAAGIGWATAQRFAAAGYAVAILDLQHEVAQERAAQLGADSLALRCDVSSEDEVKGAVAAVLERFGRLDAVVNNAGIGNPHVPTVEQSLESFERILHIHLSGAFMISREAARVMLPAGQGAIVNLSSIAGVTGLPRRNAYGAAKAGLIAMTRSMACEWAGHGIRVNAVAPGFVATELVRKLENDGSINIPRIESRIPWAGWRGRRRLPRPSSSLLTGGELCHRLGTERRWRLGGLGDAGPAS
ncbi:SDR family NAD(P)-dependent oxidoreductase [Pseudoroseomonas wenyumeiae]